MRAGLLIAAFGTATALCACGGSHGGDSGSAPPPPLTATLSGVAFASSPFQSGTVTVYAFDSGAKGAPLASTTITSGGNYSVSINAGSTVLLEVTGGCYTELATERYGYSTVQAPVCLNAGEALQAVFTPVSGTNRVMLTSYTQAAAGLSAYLVRQGTTAAGAVVSANQRFSQILGFDVVNTVPTTIDVNAITNDSYNYGALLGGMTSWLYSPRLRAAGFVFGTSPYTTIHLAELMGNDIAHDGVLNGIGTDAGGNPMTLNIATTTVDAAIYRHQVAAYAATRIRGGTGEPLSGRITDFLPFLKSYNNSNEALFGTAAIGALDEGGPTVTSLAPQDGYIASSNLWLHAVVDDIVGIQVGKAEILIDGVYYQSFPGQFGHITQFVNTTIFPNGNHTVTVRATNFLNTITTASVTLNFQN